jgi:hypothetical protein
VSVLAAEMDKWRGEERGDEGLERGAMRRGCLLHPLSLLAFLVLSFSCFTGTKILTPEEFRALPARRWTVIGDAARQERAGEGDVEQIEVEGLCSMVGDAEYALEHGGGAEARQARHSRSLDPDGGSRKRHDDALLMR